MAAGADTVESVPLSHGKEYHFSILYNYDSGPRDDTEKSLKVAKKIADTLTSIGLTASYYHEKDALPGPNIFKELFRVVEASEFIIVILTPGFVLGTWSRYTEQATFKELLDRGISHRLLPLCFGLNQNLRVPIELSTQAALEFSDDWENDEESWQKLRRVFTEQRPIPTVRMYANQRIGNPVEEANQTGGQQAEDNGPQTSVYNPTIQQYEETNQNGGQLAEDNGPQTSVNNPSIQQNEEVTVTGSSSTGEQIIYSRIPQNDYEHRVQDGITQGEIEQMLQETSLVHDGEGQIQRGVIERERKEIHPKTTLIHDGKTPGPMVTRFWVRMFFGVLENVFIADSLSRGSYDNLTAT